MNCVKFVKIMSDEEVLLLLSGDSGTSSYQDSFEEMVMWGSQSSANSIDESNPSSNTLNGKLPLGHSDYILTNLLRIYRKLFIYTETTSGEVGFTVFSKFIR